MLYPEPIRLLVWPQIAILYIGDKKEKVFLFYLRTTPCRTMLFHRFKGALLDKLDVYVELQMQEIVLDGFHLPLIAQNSFITTLQNNSSATRQHTHKAILVVRKPLRVT